MIHNSSFNNILVTGATGFVGSHLVEELCNHNAKIISIDIRENPDSYFFSNNLHRKSKYIQLNINNFSKLSALIRKEKIDCIFHLAAQPLVEQAYEDPYNTLETNILGTINVLESARMYGKVKAIIVASSDKAYGKMALKTPRGYNSSGVTGCSDSGSHGSPEVKISAKYLESDRLAGDHPYEVSKSSTDLVSQTYNKTYNLPVVITRFGNIYGEGDLHFSRLIPGIMKAFVNKEIFHIRSNGKFVRDYLYVKDVVRGYLMLADNIDRVKGEAFNFGSNDTFSVISLIRLISQICQIKLKYNILNTAKNEIPYQSLDWSKIKKTLGWKPEYSLKTTVKKIYNWYWKYFEEPHK